MNNNNKLNEQLVVLQKKLANLETEKALIEAISDSKSSELNTLNQQLSSAIESLKRHEIKMSEQDKLASIGQLAAGVAHELNTPAGYSISNLETLQIYWQDLLAYIVNLEQLIEDKTKLSAIENKYNANFLKEDIPEIISDSLIGLQKIAFTVKELKSYAHKDSEEKEHINVDDVINQAISLVGNSLKHQVAIDTDLNCSALTYCNMNKLCQVFINLIINASQACEKQAQIRITSDVKFDQIVIEITDNGKGIEEDVLPKIFDPFFTTKDVGEGTGLGLSISNNIIANHQGAMSVKSIIGEGTTFTIFLPISNENDY